MLRHSPKSTDTVAVWDPLVRVFHWSLAASFCVAYLSEDDFMSLHEWAGYTVAALVGFRLAWGLIGTRHARFGDFVTTPRKVLAYLGQIFRGDAPRYLGHNPAGGLMIVALLLSLAATALAGMAMLGMDGAGPLAGLVPAGDGEALEEIHEFLANFALFLVVLHVAGVLVSSLLHRENLVRAMITGLKPAQIDDPEHHDGRHPA